MPLPLTRNYDEAERILRELMMCLIIRRQVHGQQGLGLTECTRESQALQDARTLVAFTSNEQRGARGVW